MPSNSSGVKKKNQKLLKMVVSKKQSLLSLSLTDRKKKNKQNNFRSHHAHDTHTHTHSTNKTRTKAGKQFLKY